MAVPGEVDLRAQAGLISLSDEQLKDIADGLAMLERLGNDLEKLRACRNPAAEECAQQLAEVQGRLRAYQEHFGKVPQPSFRTRKPKR